MSNVTLTSRIIQALDESREAGPYAIAAVLLPGLSKEEMDLLVLEGLVERIRSRISLGRSTRAVPTSDFGTEAADTQPTGPQAPSGPYVWPSREELMEMLGDGSFWDLASRLGIPVRIVRLHCQKRGIADSEAREDRARAQEFSAHIGRIVRDYGDEMRADGIRIGMQQANTERVCVAGEWMFLGDCTAEQLRTLASEYAARAGANIERGAYYSAIADQVKAGSYANVREMCEAQRAERVEAGTA